MVSALTDGGHGIVLGIICNRTGNIERTRGIAVCYIVISVAWILLIRHRHRVAVGIDIVSNAACHKVVGSRRQGGKQENSRQQDLFQSGFHCKGVY